MANSADPDQLASSEANWSESTLFAKAGYIRVQQDKNEMFSFNGWKTFIIIAPDKALLSAKKSWYFSYFFTKTLRNKKNNMWIPLLLELWPYFLITNKMKVCNLCPLYETD